VLVGIDYTASLAFRLFTSVGMGSVVLDKGPWMLSRHPPGHRLRDRTPRKASARADLQPQREFRQRPYHLEAEVRISFEDA
jgi:hypothetical protein